jgi:hypothetical protein
VPLPPLLPTPTGSKELVAVIPIQALSWHRVELPRGLLGKNFFRTAARQRLRAVLDGLLENARSMSGANCTSRWSPRHSRMRRSGWRPATATG